MTALMVSAGALLAFAGALWFYRARELPVRGRTLFALLRGATLTTLILLVWNPVLPVGSDGAGSPVLILDTSSSMRARMSDGALPEARAREAAAAFDGVVRDVSAGISDATARAIEGGATGVTVVTDLRGGDGVALRALAAESEVPITVLDVGGVVANAGVASLDLPDRARPGTEVEVGIRVHATDRTERVVALVAAGDTVDRQSVNPGEPGTETIVDFTLAVPESTESTVVVEAVLEGEDALAEDDRSLGVLALDDPGGGIIAVSWAPDWEFRTLVPLLDEVSGLDARAYLALGDGRWLRASAAPAVVEAATLRSALSRAEMVVLHSAPLADTGLVALARRVPRRLELGIAEGTEGLGPSQPGEWYVSADLPVSPIATELTGVELLGLPPLVQARVSEASSGSPLLLQRAGSGTPLPAFDMRRAAGERVVEAHAEGFWRWGLRPGEARELYRRLWSALTAWLLAPDGTTRTAGFGPRAEQVAPGIPIEVVVAPDDALEIVWTSATSAQDTLRTDTLEAGAGPLATLPGFDRRDALGWVARVMTDSTSQGAAPVASGALVVQPRGTEMRPTRDTTLPEEVAALTADSVRRAGGGTPLRDSPWPWTAIILLLSAEWIGRRRSGLR